MTEIPAQNAATAANRIGWSTRRGVCLAAMLTAIAVLVLAGSLTPDPRGYGTHEALGLAPCSMKQLTGVACPSCGMTTAFSLAAHGRLFDALATQPAGAILAMGCAMIVLACGYAAWRDTPIERYIAALLRPRLIVGLIGLVVVAWIYRIIIDAGA